MPSAVSDVSTLHTDSEKDSLYKIQSGKD